jgi:tRNA nucleotidyltransferase (CCA-adding enzyme)
VRRWVRRVGLSRIEDLYVLNAADARAKGRPHQADLDALAQLKAHVALVLAEGAALSTRDLKIDGRDLMRELSIPAGPVIGRILDALLEAVIADPNTNEPDTLTALARTTLERLSGPREK